MIFIIGLPFLLFFTSINIIDIPGSFLSNLALTIFGLIILGGLAPLAGLGLAHLIGFMLPKKWKEKNPIKLVVKSNVHGILGDFVIGIGTINEKKHYFFYQGENNETMLGWTEVSSTTVIHEEERKDGLLKIFSKEFSSPFFWIFAATGESIKHEFFVPKGSVKYGFIL